MSGWKRTQDLISDEGDLGSYRFLTREGNIVDAEVTLEDGSAPIGKIEIISDGVTICVSRESGSKHLHHQLKCGLHEIDIHGPADSESSAELLADQLSRGGKNSLFKKILPVFIGLLEK
jgi:hypothetical protein